MADSNNEPDWSLLPHDPARFFGLDAGFDRRDLKRCYNQLIRRFKPERFPQEFQRIRAAYEHLEEAIRYGQSTDAMEPVGESFEWLAQAPGRPSAHSFSTSPTSPTPVVPLHELIKTGSVSKVYRELQDRLDKTPYDFYALAVMSDVVDRQKNGRQFAEWILKGLAAFPGEIGLSRLLHAYFRSPIERGHCAALLLACSKIVPEGMFFPLTESLWRALLRGQDFSDFRDTLRQCEANLKGVHIDNRLAFYMQILKPAVWVADPEWISEAYGFIEENHDRIPSYLDYDLEILARLREYIRHRDVFASGNALHRQFDKALRDYFSEEQLAGDRSVIECQIVASQDKEGLAAAFSNFGNAGYSAFFAVWNWVSYDVGERHVETPDQPPDANIWFSRTQTLVTQIKTQTDNSRLGVTWAILTWVYLSARALCFVVPIGLLIALSYWLTSLDEHRPRMGQLEGTWQETDWGHGTPRRVETVTNDADSALDPLNVIGIMLSLVLGCVAGYFLQRELRQRMWIPYCIRMAGRCYRQLWQREIINFLDRSHLDYHTFIAFLNQCAITEGKASWAKYYVDQDYALPVFAIAHRFMV